MQRNNKFFIFFVFCVLLTIAFLKHIPNIPADKVDNSDIQKTKKINTREKIKIDRIILVSIDTLRKDHLSFTGYPLETSPFIDGLSENGLNFSNAFSHNSVTPPASASVFTSLYPLQHGLFDFDTKKPDNSYLMLAEFLKEKGFKTAAFTSLDHASLGNNFQGFDTYSIPKKIRAADKTFGLALNWLDEIKKNDKFFVWTHIDDPHGFFKSEKKYYEKISKMIDNKPGEDEFLNYLFNEQKIDLDCTDGLPLPAKRYQHTKEEILDKIIDYDAKINFVDNEFEKFYNELTKRGLNKNILWIITSEHGEGLCSHNHAYHGTHIYNELLKVPLIFYFSDMEINKNIDKIVEHIDVLPTVAELVGFDLSKQIKSIQGTSLLTFLDDKPSFPDKYAFSQRRYYSENSDFKDKGKMFSLQNEKYKYILNEHKQDEFYNLIDDPHELNNLINKNISQKDEFKKEILKRIAKFTDTNNIINTKDKELEKKLENLGYFK
ncbi:sulfatase [Candidatus Falkowbacteria bacterium]|jgi:arylsulfatase A-like enzyme|nr:sulfatase [Candidatus Falkowbacteria bacterium]MBT4433441.1 sulfatase [Candidatus Falkowbacteria bacterium]